MRKNIYVSIAGLILGAAVCLGMAACGADIDTTTGATPELTGTITTMDTQYKTFDGHGYYTLNDNGSITVTIEDWNKFSSCKMYGVYAWCDTGATNIDGEMVNYSYGYDGTVDVDVQNVMGEPVVWVTTDLECEDYNTGETTKFGENKREIVGIVNEDTNTMVFSFHVGDGANGNLDMIFAHYEED